MDHIFKQRSSKEICKRYESKWRFSYKAFETTIVWKVSWFNFSEDSFRTGLPITDRILAPAKYVENNPCVRKDFYTLFHFKRSFGAQFNGGRFLLTVLSFVPRSAFATLNITTPSVLEVHILYHSIGMVAKDMQSKAHKYFCLVSTGILIGYNVPKKGFLLCGSLV